MNQKVRGWLTVIALVVMVVNSIATYRFVDTVSHYMWCMDGHMIKQFELYNEALKELSLEVEALK